MTSEVDGKSAVPLTAVADHAGAGFGSDVGVAGADCIRPQEESLSAGLRVSHLSKTFGRSTVVDDVSLAVAPGEVHSIIGPSGSGKSTLLRCINLIDPPTSGTLSVGAASLVFGGPKAPDRKAMRRFRARFGMVFQHFNLFPHLTVLDNVVLAQRHSLGRSRQESRERGLAELARVGLRDRADYYPSQCSGGQQQRVAIARALALDPSVMLFDEPTSGLDPEIGVEVLNVMKALSSAGTTMLVVTHEMAFARDVSSNVVVMDHGAIIESGPPREVMSTPRTERTKRFLSAVLDR